MTDGQGFKRAGSAALLAGLLCASGLATGQVLSATATPSPAVVGSPLALNVLITGVVDLFAYQFSLAFNPLVLQVASATEGAFLPTAGATIFDGGVVDNTLGTMTLTFGTLTGPVPGASGSGVLANINFNVILPGSSTLTFSEVVLLDSNLATLAVQVNNAMITAVPEPTSYALFALGLAGLAALRQRRAG